jgi:hypothetical protein
VKGCEDSTPLEKLKRTISKRIKQNIEEIARKLVESRRRYIV